MAVQDLEVFLNIHILVVSLLRECPTTAETGLYGVIYSGLSATYPKVVLRPGTVSY